MIAVCSGVIPQAGIPPECEAEDFRKVVEQSETTTRLRNVHRGTECLQGNVCLVPAVFPPVFEVIETGVYCERV